MPGKITDHSGSLRLHVPHRPHKSCPNSVGILLMQPLIFLVGNFVSVGHLPGLTVNNRLSYSEPLLHFILRAIKSIKICILLWTTWGLSFNCCTGERTHIWLLSIEFCSQVCAPVVLDWSEYAIVLR